MNSENQIWSLIWSSLQEVSLQGSQTQEVPSGRDETLWSFKTRKLLVYFEWCGVFVCKSKTVMVHLKKSNAHLMLNSAFFCVFQWDCVDKLAFIQLFISKTEKKKLKVNRHQKQNNRSDWMQRYARLSFMGHSVSFTVLACPLVVKVCYDTTYY